MIKNEVFTYKALTNSKLNSKIDKDTMIKSKIFQLFLKYSLPKAIIFTIASSRNTLKNT